MLRVSWRILAVVPVVVLLLQVRSLVLAGELNEDVEQVQKAAQDQGSSVAVEKAVEQARKTGATMLLPENIHSQKGLEAARQTLEQFNAPAFQEELRCQQAKIQGNDSVQEEAGTTKKDGKLTSQESVYLFLSSSMPDVVVNRYLIDIGRTGDQRISPVLFGLPQGLEGKRFNADYFSRVMQADPGCQDTPETRCQRLEMSLRVNPVLFAKFNITEVPALVYENGQDSWSIHGDAELAYLLEKVGKAANTPSLAGISARLRGGH